MSARASAPIATDGLFRDRLIGRLRDSHRQRKSIWIQAPGGYGKSTLAASYVQADKLHHLWYRLDDGDADLAAFLERLGTEFLARGAEPVTAERSLPSAGFLAGDALINLGRDYLRELFAQVPKPFVLIFDEIEKIPEDSPTVAALAAACEDLPGGVQVLLVGRGAPWPAYSRLEMNDQLVRLGPTDLQFNVDETRALLRSAGLPDSEARAIDLQRRTHGWAAGIRLMLHHARGDHTDRASLDPATQHLLAGYFTSEVLVDVSDELLNGLMTLSLVDTLPNVLISRLVGAPELPQLLHRLADQRLFVDRLAGSELVFRLHPMLRSFLAARMASQRTVESIRDAKLSAGRLLVEHKRYDEAIALYSECGAIGEVCAMIGQFGVELVNHAQFVRLRQWLQRVPHPIRTSDPWMIYWDGTSSLYSEPSVAKEKMRRAYELFLARAEDPGIVLSWAGNVDAIFNEYAIFEQLDPWLDNFDRDIAPRLAGLDPGITCRALVSRFTGLIFRRPDDPALAGLEQQIRGMLTFIPDPSIVVFVRCQLFLHGLWSGNLPAARMELSALHDMTDGPEAVPLGKLLTLLNSATLNLFTGELLDCEADVEKALTLTGQTGLRLWDAVLWGHRISALTARGLLEQAEACLPELRKSLIHNRHSEISRYYGFMAWFAAKRGAAAEAEPYMAQSLADVDLGGIPIFRAIARLTLADARASIEPGDPRVRTLLDEAVAIGTEINNPMLQWTGRTALIGLQAVQGASEPSAAEVADVFAIGADRNYLHFMSWPRELIGRACEIALEQGIEPDYVRRLIRHNRIVPSAAGYATDNWPWPVKIRTLGRFVIQLDEELLSPRKKQPKVPFKLLQAVIAAGGRNVSEQKICDLLWPDAEADSAPDNLKAALHRLRDLLKVDCIVRQGGRLSLDNRLVWVDVWALERAIRRTPDAAALKPSQINRLYQGPFLESEEELWTISMRARLHDSLVAYLIRQSSERLESGDLVEAEAYLQSGLQVDDLVEGFYAGIMQCQLARNDLSAVVQTYRRCEQILKSRLNVLPSARTTHLYRQAVKPR